MLKKLVRERLMAAAEEILAQFERTIASYEEELSRTREENERLRQQLEADSKTGGVLHSEDVQQLIGHPKEPPPEPQAGSSMLKQDDPQPPHIKEEGEELWITQEAEEADLSKLPLTVVSVKTEERGDKPPDPSRWSCPSDFQQMIDCEEELHPQPQGGGSTWRQEDAELPRVKEEGEDLWITQEVEYHQDLIKLPLTVKTEEHEDKPGESSQLHHSPGEDTRGDNMTSCEDKDNLRGPLSHHAEREGDTRTPNKHSECSKRKTGRKRLACSLCAESFSFKCYLTRHILSHTGERAFVCSVCGKRFVARVNMASHMRTHTEEHPVRCTLCGHSSSYQKSLTVQTWTPDGE
ncbi:zinc finger and SCAN domain-containing protein 21-like [Dunckerocampus dactyliophorus]|uniref:zinc finger and SCAN domain-containing protein 21-like n=1 Tax=Dunckerocampus dactyliophorus TaxID=161453 RepID=UPI0024068892|nr:zinc finger and SCAN domain-containing protein 21-like [Dunckerocampus dactyliophorus]